jgi:hypothetical protein
MAQSPSERIVRRGRVFPEIQWTEEQKAQDRARHFISVVGLFLSV